MRIYSNEVPQITKTCTPFAQAAKFMSVKLPPFSAGLHKSGTALTQKAGCLSPDSQPFFVCFYTCQSLPGKSIFSVSYQTVDFPLIKSYNNVSVNIHNRYTTLAGFSNHFHRSVSVGCNVNFPVLNTFLVQIFLYSCTPWTCRCCIYNYVHIIALLIIYSNHHKTTAYYLIIPQFFLLKHPLFSLIEVQSTSRKLLTSA